MDRNTDIYPSKQKISMTSLVGIEVSFWLLSILKESKVAREEKITKIHTTNNKVVMGMHIGETISSGENKES